MIYDIISTRRIKDKLLEFGKRTNNQPPANHLAIEIRIYFLIKDNNTVLLIPQTILIQSTNQLQLTIECG